MKYTLVTGGLGFIGLNYIKSHILKKNIINIDSKTYAANKINIKFSNKYIFCNFNIGNKKKIEYIFNNFKIANIINFAAETHVDNSIARPEKIIKNNIVNFLKFLEVFKIFFLSGKIDKKIKFINVSTDEVYGSLSKTDRSFTEFSKYNPRNPYSASKASVDHICNSFCQTFGLPIITVHFSNNFGPYQHDEKFIPTIIRNVLSGDPIPIYGKGDNVRDWLYVNDTCLAIDKVIKKGKIGEVYNFGGENEISNLALVKKICKILNKKFSNKKLLLENQITFVEDRLGHDFRYSINSNKAKKQLKWKQKSNFEKSLTKSIEWYVNKYKNLIKK